MEVCLRSNTEFDIFPSGFRMKFREHDDLVCKDVKSIGTASANSAKFRGIRQRMYIEDLL